MKKIIKKIIVLVILLFIVGLTFAIKSGYDVYKEAIAEKSIEQKINEIKSEKKNYTYIGDLPDKYVPAVLSVEDVRFYKHHGIDLISIARAIDTDIKTFSFAEGGSTITQQLAKNVYFSQKKELTRKIAEIFMAREFEKNCSKEEILELYINTIYYGDGYYSVYDAAMGYFNKEPKDLDLNEITLLVGIPNAPSKYSPSVNPELSKQRQKQVIKKMLKYNYLTNEEAEELYTKIGKIYLNEINKLLYIQKEMLYVGV